MAKKKAVKKEPGKAKRRMDWKLNDDMIEETFIKLMMKNNKKPSYEAVAKELNLNVMTVKRHVGNMDFQERFLIYRLGTPKVIMNLLKQAATGRNHQMVRMWLELFEGLGEKKKVDITSNGNEIIIPTAIATATFEQLQNLVEGKSNSGGKS